MPNDELTILSTAIAISRSHGLTKQEALEWARALGGATEPATEPKAELEPKPATEPEPKRTLVPTATRPDPKRHDRRRSGTVVEPVSGARTAATARHHFVIVERARSTDDPWMFTVMRSKQGTRGIEMMLNCRPKLARYGTDPAWAETLSRLGAGKTVLRVHEDLGICLRPFAVERARTLARLHGVPLLDRMYSKEVK